MSPGYPPPPSAPDEINISRYELLGRIGTGGMASVYAARTRGLGGFERVVALKVCHPHLRHDEQFVKMFLAEARLAALIHHPNVVATIDVGEADALFLVMEYVDGGRLADLLNLVSTERNEQIPLDIALRIFCDVLNGLHAAHEVRGPDGRYLGLVHRDVSPENILVGSDGLSRITDFGIAKAEDSTTHTQQGSLRGKLAYMAPEQLLGGRATRQTDLFATAVILWEAIVGSRLFKGRTPAETVNKVLTEPIARPSQTRPHVPPALDTAVMKGLSRNASGRFSMAADFAEALEKTGVSLASHRAVGNYLQARLETVLAQRRKVLGANAVLPSSPEAREETTSSEIAQPTALAPAERRWVAFPGLRAVLLTCVALGALVLLIAALRREVPQAQSATVAPDGEPHLELQPTTSPAETQSPSVRPTQPASPERQRATRARSRKRVQPTRKSTEYRPEGI